MCVCLPMSQTKTGRDEGGKKQSSLNLLICSPLSYSRGMCSSKTQDNLMRENQGSLSCQTLLQRLLFVFFTVCGWTLEPVNLELPTQHLDSSLLLLNVPQWILQQIQIFIHIYTLSANTNDRRKCTVC